METILDIPVRKTTVSRLDEVAWNELEFGKYMSDHMFTCHYRSGSWQQPRILPFQDISIPPTALALHYGQSVFEGMKAFRMEDGNINIFMMERHHQRLNRSLDRMCMPEIPYEI
ncbi:MAG TPA: branched chain amino acid aminotransferase, partial [Chitinophagaceae bacterium]|nr:branched chain amino acid aminotransferase [Chitinophagaceae bacterium]